ncbi:MAG: Cystathionine beta-lyase, type II (EC 4.4.1.8) [Olavius algarvensis Gamma 3 endosymbiont]|nr:MAG: Cystathionine beta-lyase, type II (EC 4.4.1.8) [Olavius algarvensis Gamma 3 endosymbiont]
MSVNYDFDRVIDRSNATSAKWERYRGRDILPMWVADTDFAVLPEIQQALRQRTQHPVFGYGHTPERLTEMLVARMRRLYDWEIDPDWLVFLPGIVGALYLACRATGKPGDAVYRPQIIYPPFAKAPQMNAQASRPIPMCMRDRRMIIDLDWLERQSASPGRLLLLCNPQNPGGAIYRAAELRRLAEIVERQELLICSDEIHCDLILDRGKRHIPIASLGPAIEQRSITLMAPSKTFNVAGLGCAFAIVPDAELRVQIKVNPYIVPHVNVLGLAAAEAAYEYGDEWVRQQCEYLAANRDYLIREINRIPGLSLGPIEATYLAWIDVSELQLEDPMTFFENAGLGMSPGRDFGDKDFMRLNFGCPRSRVEQAVERIRKAVETLR